MSNDQPSKLALSLIGAQKADSMRYQFIPNEGKPGFILVYDTKMKQVFGELVEEHARMAFLMYKNLYDRHPLAGDEWMYGHLMGWTLTLLHMDHYPKTEKVVEDGVTYVVITDRKSGHVTKNRVKDEDNIAAANEIAQRVDPKFGGFQEGGGSDKA